MDLEISLCYPYNRNKENNTQEGGLRMVKAKVNPWQAFRKAFARDQVSVLDVFTPISILSHLSLYANVWYYAGI